MKSYDQPRQHIKKQRYYFAKKGPSSQSYSFSSSHAWMWELDYKERWAPKNWCFWTKAEAPILANSNTWCKELTHLKRPWCWERLKVGGEGEDRWWDGWMASPAQWKWVWVNSRNWWWTGRSGCYSPWGHKELDMTEQLSWTELNLPRFMDLTFQVPMQYCSLQHGTLFPSPVTSTTGHCFCFDSASSFFLELFLHSSLVAYWASTYLRSSSFSVLSYWSGLPIPSPVDHVLSELSTMTCSSWVTLHGMAHSLIELDKAVLHVWQGCDPSDQFG